MKLNQEWMNFYVKQCSLLQNENLKLDAGRWREAIRIVKLVDSLSRWQTLPGPFKKRILAQKEKNKMPKKKGYSKAKPKPKPKAK